jgi:hypothetical protein
MTVVDFHSIRFWRKPPGSDIRLINIKTPEPDGSTPPMPRTKVPNDY